MADTPPSAGGGALIALGSIAGAAIGFVFSEATRGFLIGLALGILAAILIWRRDLRR